MGRLLYGCGIAIFIAGIALIIGNVTGFFRTFPFAGYLTTVIGAAIQGAGSKLIAQTSDTYRVTCCHCKAELTAKKEFAGQQTTCGACKQAIILPEIPR